MSVRGMRLRVCEVVKLMLAGVVRSGSIYETQFEEQHW